MTRCFADDGRLAERDNVVVRDLLAGVAVLGVLLLVAVAPAWERTHGSTATAVSPSPQTVKPTPTPTPISAPYDTSKALLTGPGFSVCGASDTWTRPTLPDQNAHLAADPRYSSLRVDDGSFAARQFHAVALVYDGSGNSTRNGLVMSSGLWSDPRINRAGCGTKEQQVWLFGYAPDSYEVLDGASAVLNVHARAGYRMVVITGEPRRALVVFDGQRKLDLLTMHVAVATPAASPLPPFPTNARPLELVLPPSCAVTSSDRHTDGLGNTWYVQCGVGKINVSVPGEAVRQGWILIGADAPDGTHLFHKGALSMQIFFRRDGAGIADPFGILQTYRPLAAPTAVSPAPRPTP